MKQSRVEERQVATQERSEARFYAKMGATGRVTPGWHGNGKRVSMKARYYIEFNESTRL